MRLRIDLAYDGTAFKGWARQPALRTVQGELEGALDTVLRTEGNAVTVAGRTDTGVHARGQVAHLDVEEAVLVKAAGRAPDPIDSLVRRVNGVLDPDVRVLGASEAPAGFDARFSAIWRRYAYRIVDDPSMVDPLTRDHVLAWPRPLDLDAMNAGAARLVGFHDFASFCKKREGATTIRTLLDFEWTRLDGVLTATVRADAFCHSMVRALVGCLIAVGEGKQTPEWAEAVLAGRERTPGFSVAPAHGLTLEEVGYPDDEGLAAQAEQARARREL
ncbi:tRNA pseudouridine(38-40) synthase TruA [Nocardioides marmorisolisilvae]|uniref:tRNA pseudouridine(38-40) synthase TruA n=1 Tax=Nocardioides marmorisolisilvae TaxID=1542737 RepID=UPI001FE4C93D|nr:tRNA pseudouridine(38-40) synthase TruA [Nocardioides marmorisolisilvae]